MKKIEGTISSGRYKSHAKDELTKPKQKEGKTQKKIPKQENLKSFC